MANTTYYISGTGDQLQLTTADQQKVNTVELPAQFAQSQDIAEAASVGDILDNSIEGVKLKDGAVTTSKIENLTIRDEDISNNPSFAITGTKIQQANTTTRGTVQLYNAADSTSTTLAATANALKTVNDTLTTAINTIDATQPFTRTSTGTGRPLVVGEHVTVTAATQSFDLPATPTNGQTLRISVGNFTDTVITRNGSNIMASDTDLTIDVALKTITLMYDTNDDGSGSNTVGWRII